MDLKEIKEIMRQVVENDISEFEYEESGVKIRIKRQVVAFQPNPGQTSSPSSTSVSSAEDRDNLYSKEAAKSASSPGDLYVVTSPIVGTFFRASNPSAEPFVEIGDPIEEGSVLCIIEAMKLMNEIRSDVAGEVADIFVENGQPVEYGQQLFALKKASQRLEIASEAAQVQEND